MITVLPVTAVFPADDESDEEDDIKDQGRLAIEEVRCDPSVIILSVME